jgi:hypothetical protein
VGDSLSAKLGLGLRRTSWSCWDLPGVTGIAGVAGILGLLGLLGRWDSGVTAGETAGILGLWVGRLRGSWSYGWEFWDYRWGSSKIQLPLQLHGGEGGGNTVRLPPAALNRTIWV